MEQEIIGHAYKELKEIIKRYTQNDSPVLFVGGMKQISQKVTG